MTKVVQIVNASNMDETISVHHVTQWADNTFDLPPGKINYLSDGVAVVVPGPHANDSGPMMNADGERTYPTVEVGWTNGPPVKEAETS